jgi:serine/threonine-protein kinase
MQFVTADLPVMDFPPDPEGVSKYFQVPTTEVPDVTGLSQSAAKTAILHAGLRANIVIVASSEPEGTLLGQSPSAGSKVKQGGSVTVRYSSGVPAIMPDWIGKKAGTIEQRIASFNETTGLGVTYRIIEQPTSDPSLVGRIVTTRPRPGSAVAEGREIVFIVGTAQP